LHDSTQRADLHVGLRLQLRERRLCHAQTIGQRRLRHARLATDLGQQHLGHQLLRHRLGPSLTLG